VIAAGASASPAWTIDQNAATLWYHPHLDGETERQAAMGLDGMFIVHDDAEAALPLPRDYGVDDIPVIVQDVRFDEHNQFTSDVQGYIGAIGDELLVNGTIGPYLDVTTDLVRLRLLNASTARSYDFGFDDGRGFSLIATDGGLLGAPVDTDHIQLSPGERAEILVSVTPGETTILRSTPPDLGQDSAQAEKNAGADSLDVLQLRAAASLESVATVPDTLVPMTAMLPADAAVTRTFTLSDATINGKRMDMTRVDAAVTLGSTEVWSISNSMAQPHSFHVHGLQFQVLTVDAEPPPPELSGWKDTVFVPPGAQIRIIMRFDDYADASVPYMFHCHMLTHEDDGMMGQFVVVRAGEEPQLDVGGMSMNGMGH
jgi:FtsP/CotA-like multicopper oxidase with cupredoxin domain